MQLIDTARDQLIDLPLLAIWMVPPQEVHVKPILIV